MPKIYKYTVEKSLLPANKRLSERECYLILNNGIPEIDINRVFINQVNKITKEEKRSGRCSSTLQHQFCKFLNYLEENNINYINASLSDIEDFLCDLQLKDGIKNSTIHSYINIIVNIYEELYLRDYKLHSSLISYNAGLLIHKSKDRSVAKHTVINLLKVKFSKEKKEYAMPSYLKWYSFEEIEKISLVLPLEYSCIFLISVFTGYRFDSVVSIFDKDFNPVECSVKNSRSKSGLTHVAFLPKYVIDMIEKYRMHIRSLRYNGKSDYLFLNPSGETIRYHSYNQALKKAGEKLNMPPLHTHAGRSTFLAMLRTYQLEKRRLGEPVFSDIDLMLLMDWKTLSSLENYDKMNRVEQIPPFINEIFQNYFKEHKNI